jgi:hypothetical protein
MRLGTRRQLVPMPRLVLRRRAWPSRPAPAECARTWPWPWPTPPVGYVRLDSAHRARPLVSWAAASLTYPSNSTLVRYGFLVLKVVQLSSWSQFYVILPHAGHSSLLRKGRARTLRGTKLSLDGVPASAGACGSEPKISHLRSRTYGGGSCSASCAVALSPSTPDPW